MLAGPDVLDAVTMREGCQRVLRAVMRDVLDDARARMLIEPETGAPLFGDQHRSPTLDRAQDYVDTAEARLRRP